MGEIIYKLNFYSIPYGWPSIAIMKSPLPNLSFLPPPGSGLVVVVPLLLLPGPSLLEFEGETVLKLLAKEIVEKAREMSLDKNRDSPFALLAKENDIMWGGGMPDDTSVLVARVVKNNDVATSSIHAIS